MKASPVPLPCAVPFGTSSGSCPGGSCTDDPGAECGPCSQGYYGPLPGWGPGNYCNMGFVRIIAGKIIPIPCPVEPPITT